MIFGCCKRNKKEKSKIKERKTPGQIFKEGKEMVESYLDIVKLVRSFREMQVFISTVLTQR
jgi:hypothetical protein